VGDRSYDQYCGVARALDLVGERWAMLVVRELLIGPKRFTDLQHGLPGIGTNILSARLKQLERGGVVHRRFLPPPAASTVYELTEYGRDLEEPLLGLGRWGAQSLGPRLPAQTLRSGWLALALKSFFRPDAARGLTATFELRLSDGTYHVRVAARHVEITTGPAIAPDLVLETDNDTLLGLIAGAVDPKVAYASHALHAEGDPALLGRFVEVFGAERAAA
jgi:DNA-binding HxlR family transcriptional regulator/putative sterol carrier protein